MRGGDDLFGCEEKEVLLVAEEKDDPRIIEEEDNRMIFSPLRFVVVNDK